MLPIITKGELTFRSIRTLPAGAQSSGSETLLRIQFLAGCTIGMLESSIRKRAGVPTEYRTARTKPELALAEIDRVITTGVRFGCVLADAGYGLSAPFRQGLTARKLTWAVGIPRHLKVYPADVRMIWPVAKRGRPRQRHVPDILSIPAEDMLANAKWHTISWRTVTKR